MIWMGGNGMKGRPLADKFRLVIANALIRAREQRSRSNLGCKLLFDMRIGLCTNCTVLEVSPGQA